MTSPFLFALDFTHNLASLTAADQRGLDACGRLCLSGASPCPSREELVSGTLAAWERPPEAADRPRPEARRPAHLALPVGGPVLRLPQLVGAARQQVPAAGQRAAPQQEPMPSLDQRERLRAEEKGAECLF